MIQANQFSEHASVMVLPVISALLAVPLLHVTVQPSAVNGLRKPPRIMIDNAMTVKRGKAGAAFGRIDSEAMVEVERCLAVFLGIAK